MHIGMKETVAQRLGEEAADHQHRNALGIVAGFHERRRIADGRAVDPFRREDAAGRARPIDGGYAKIAIVDGEFGQFGGSSGLHSQIEFERDGGSQRIDQRDHAKPTRFGRDTFGHARGKCEGRQVACEIQFNAGAQHFDGHAARLLVRGHRPMYLRNRCGGDGFPKNRKHFVQRAAEFRFDGRPRNILGEWRQAILQAFKRARDLVADQIGARGQHLTELDIGGPKTLQRKGEPDAGRHIDIGLARTTEEKLRDLERERRALGIFARHQRIVTREHARRMQKTSCVAEGPEHRYIRHAECIAAIPPVRLRTFTRESPARSIIFAKAAWGGNFLMLSAR